VVITTKHHDFPYDPIHPECPGLPGKSYFEADLAAMNTANKSRDIRKYRQYMKDQLTELLTMYGQIDELFLDFSYDEK
jgi:alpha-L-fucosidase